LGEVEDALNGQRPEGVGGDVALGDADQIALDDHVASRHGAAGGVVDARTVMNESRWHGSVPCSGGLDQQIRRRGLRLALELHAAPVVLQGAAEVEVAPELD